MNNWDEAQKLEKDWWASCANTFGEEQKQTVYAKKMGLKVYDDGNSPFCIDKTGLAILDIGGGPVSMLLKTKANLRVAIDPCDYPEWVKQRYEECGIKYSREKGEDIPQDFDKKFDEVWIYNCLQHVDNPQKIIDNAKRVGKLIRMFEWIGHETNAMHPHKLMWPQLDEWLGGKGKVENINELGCVGEAYYGTFNLSLNNISMTDAQYQAGMIAAIQAYQATITYPVIGFSFSYTTPGVVPSVEDVPVVFPS